MMASHAAANSHRGRAATRTQHGRVLILAAEPIRAVHKERINLALGGLVAYALQPGSDEGRAALAIILIHPEGGDRASRPVAPSGPALGHSCVRSESINESG